MHLTDHTVTRLPNEELKAAPGQNRGLFVYPAVIIGILISETKRIMCAYSCKSLVGSTALDITVKNPGAEDIGPE